MKARVIKQITIYKKMTKNVQILREWNHKNSVRSDKLVIKTQKGKTRHIDKRVTLFLSLRKMREINGTQCGKTTHATQFFLTKFQVFCVISIPELQCEEWILFDENCRELRKLHGHSVEIMEIYCHTPLE